MSAERQVEASKLPTEPIIICAEGVNRTKKTSLVRRHGELLPPEAITPVILNLRGQRVILDHDLARIYSVETRVLNQAVKRNSERFPPQFIFQLTADELRQTAALRSQSVILKKARGRHPKYLPRAFTEHGALMAAAVLNSPRAVQMSVFVVQAFVKMRRILSDTRELARKLAALEQELKDRLDVHEAAIVDILQRIMKLLEPPPPEPEPPRKEMGFHIKEDAVPYRIKRKLRTSGVPSTPS